MSDIKVLGVVGAGQMGGGIAQVAAQSGVKVLLRDVNVELVDRALQSIGRGLDKLVEKGKLSADDRAAAIGRIRGTAQAGDFAECDLLIEAATEHEEVKKKILIELDGIAKEGAILATNTSSISITRLAAVTKRPERFIGMHFMNPVPAMRLVEIIPGLKTSELTIQETRTLAERLGKTTVRSDDQPGFIVNRILIPMINEAVVGLMEGLGTPEDIDTAMKLGTNQPMGPLELADFIGLDTCLSIMEVLHGQLGDDKYRPAPLLRRYVAAGWLGKKTGRGFYRYDPR
ncbi:MAG: 3-hydroxybutyryl-CoA dehydrogenase [Deltaproteobacteria bacterium]|nr:3-hydroxybutyryl-CoA dehydrogenase [Deltaproteobacteria bacterium]